MTNESPSEPLRLNLTHVILTLVGITGLALFILACQPSWSPDGQKVLYSYWDAGAQKAAVALFDRKAKKSRVIFEWSNEEESGDVFLAGAQWTKDGAKAVISMYQEKNLQLLALPIGSDAPMRTYTLQKVGEALTLPLPQSGDNLFVMSDQRWTRVNLATGEIFSKEAGGTSDCLFYEATGRVIYFRQGEAGNQKAKKVEDSQAAQELTPNTYELGELNPKEMSLQATLTLTPAELNKNGITDFNGMLDEDPRSARIAAISDTPAKVVVIGKHGIEKVLDAGIGEKGVKLGNPQWSRDGKTIFVIVLITRKETKTAELAVVEVPVDGKSVRIDRIQKGPEGEFGSDFLSYQQIALSPDGKLIAVSNGHVKDLRPERRGLYLLDVSKESRPVSFYPAPALSALPKKD